MRDVLVPGDQRKNWTSQAFVLYSIHIAWLLSTDYVAFASLSGLQMPLAVQ